MRPTVIHVANYGGPYSGSFIPMLRAAARSVRARGWGFECAFTSVARGRPWLSELAADGIEPAFAADGAERADLEQLIERLAPADGPLILHTHFTGFDLAATAVARRRPDAAAIWHIHSYLAPGPKPFLRAAVKFRLLSRGSWVVCVSPGTYVEARRRGASTRRLRLIENAIDTARFDLVDPGERREARERLGLRDGDQALLHFAWDWEVKGGPLFSETVAALRERGLPVVGLSVGAGDNALEAAARLGLGGALRPVAASDDVRSFYAAADAMVAASAAEGAPLAMLEALSSGVGVVATSIPGHRLASDPPAALKLAGMSPTELADSLARTLARSDAERTAEAQEAHGWAVANRDIAVWSARVLDLYDEVLVSSGNAAAISAGGSS